MLKRSAGPTQGSQNFTQQQHSPDTYAKRSRLSDAKISDAYAGSVTATDKVLPSPQSPLEPPLKKMSIEETKEFWQAAGDLKHQ